MSLSRKIARMKAAAEGPAADGDPGDAPPPERPTGAPDPGAPPPEVPAGAPNPGAGAPPPPGRLRRLLSVAGRLALGGLALGLVLAAAVVWSLSHDLPSFETLKDYHPLQTTRIVSADGQVVGRLFQERRTVVPYSDMPPVLIHAIVAAEDEHFFEHQGLDYGGILRAAIKDVLAMRVKQGASTITQQVVKTFLLTPRRTFTRKIREMILATRLERHLSKDEILYLYLNQIYFGHGRYGVEAASEFYFGKPVHDVDPAEASILAGLPKAPAYYSPKRYPKHARKRQAYVLGRMVADGFVTKAQADAARAEPLNLAPTPPKPPGAWYVKEVTQRLVDRFGKANVFGAGLTVKVAMDSRLQGDAEAAVKDTLRSVDRRQGYRGPLIDLDRPARQAVAEAFVKQVDRRRQRGLDDDPVVWDLSGLRGWDPAHAPAAPVTLARPDPDTLVGGLVTAVNPKAGTADVDLGTARVVLHLEGLKWARPFDPARYTRPPRSISDVVGVGDVVEVRLGEVGDTAPLVRSEDATRKRAPAPATLPELPGTLGQVPRVEGALVAIDPTDRHVLALVGGYDAAKSQFDRATQAKRQPGSSFKPFVYGAALQSKQYTVASRVLDAPEVIRDSWSGQVWKPEDAEAGFEGEMSLRRALAESKNVVAVRVLANVGIDKVIDFARRAGITSALPHFLPLALGTGEVTPLEMTNAYTTFAAGGVHDDPALILEVDAPDGTVLYQHQGHPSQTISPEVSYLVTNLLESVLTDGTGRHLQLGRPAAGKTGTANNQRDAWFVGFTPGLVAGAWVGFDTPRTLGPHEYGARAAGPAWQAFMSAALQGKDVRGFTAPPDIDFVRVDQDTGLLAAPGSPGVYQPFLPGTEPTQVAPPHGLSPDAFPFVDQRLSAQRPKP